MRVPGCGNRHATIMCIGEAPGYYEGQSGKPFVGATGDELDRLLEANKLPPRHKLWLTNIYRFYEGKDYEYTAADLARDEPTLLAELRLVKPKIIVALGRHAARYFLGDIDLDSTWGIPWMLPPTDKLSFLGNCTVFVSYHPAAGMHNPELSPYVVAGFSQLASFCAGILEPRILGDDPYPNPVYELLVGEAVQDALQRL